MDSETDTKIGLSTKEALNKLANDIAEELHKCQVRILIIYFFVYNFICCFLVSKEKLSIIFILASIIVSSFNNSIDFQMAKCLVTSWRINNLFYSIFIWAFQ